MIDKLLLNPFVKSVKTENLSAILMFAATVIAIIWANSPLSYIYEQLWSYKVGVQVTSDYELIKPLVLWINDGLMAIFFFHMGLEIKRELLVGELDSPKKAVFPLFAALGGIAVPILIFVLVNQDPGNLRGWAIPMATDHAFSLAILNLLSKRIPLNVKVFLTAFAVLDSLGVVLFIGLFYSSGITWGLILAALGLLVLLFILAQRNLYSQYLLAIVSVAVWILFLKSGIHPTIAGVLLAITVPIREKLGPRHSLEELDEIVADIKETVQEGSAMPTKEQFAHIDNLEEWTSQVQSPLLYQEEKLHKWVAYLILPIFALANAGVTINPDTTFDFNLILAIAAGLFVGKSVGLFFLSNFALRTGLSRLPAEMRYSHLLGVSFLAGVGFTMSIFIANLAFQDDLVLLNSAKVGILIGSSLAAVAGYFILRMHKKVAQILPITL